MCVLKGGYPLIGAVPQDTPLIRAVVRALRSDTHELAKVQPQARGQEPMLQVPCVMKWSLLDHGGSKARHSSAKRNHTQGSRRRTVYLPIVIESPVGFNNTPLCGQLGFIAQLL